MLVEVVIILLDTVPIEPLLVWNVIAPPVNVVPTMSMLPFPKLEISMMPLVVVPLVLKTAVELPVQQIEVSLATVKS